MSDDIYHGLLRPKQCEFCGEHTDTPCRSLDQAAGCLIASGKEPIAHVTTSEGGPWRPFYGAAVQLPDGSVWDGVLQRWREQYSTEDKRLMADEIMRAPVGDVFNAPADNVHQPAHYARRKMQAIEYIAINNLEWWEANVVKYIARYDAKDGLQDLYKARSYLDMKIRQLEAHERFWEKPVAIERALNGSK